MSILQSPTTKTSIEQKIRARNCALMLKNGSPKLRDLLRDKCRSRMKQNREDAFANSRNIQIERSHLINRIVREELSNEIESDIELQDIILREILDNFEQWQTEQAEEYEKQMIIDFNDNEGVICPVCEYRALNLNENIITCTCGLRLYYSKSLREFYDQITSSCHHHERMTGCTEKLKFFAEPRHGFKVLALSSMCYSCDFFAPIVEIV